MSRLSDGEYRVLRWLDQHPDWEIRNGRFGAPGLRPRVEVMRCQHYLALQIAGLPDAEIPLGSYSRLLRAGYLAADDAANAANLTDAGRQAVPS